VKVFPRTRAYDIEQFARSVDAGDFRKVRHHALKKSKSNDHVELCPLNPVYGRNGDTGPFPEYLSKERDIADVTGPGLLKPANPRL
jgi:hypothetical protein